MSTTPYTEHRARLLERLAAENAAAVIPTGGLKVRNHDCEYRFRPHSDFWYLTGFAEPESVLVLLPGADEPSILFLRERDKQLETWNGRRLGVEAAPAALGVDGAADVAELWDELPELLKGYEKIVYRAGDDEARDRRFLELVGGLRKRARGNVLPPIELLDPAPFLHELRLFKSAAELEFMRRAAAITTEAHIAAMATSAPGVNEAEIDALLDYTFRRRGGTGQSYNNIVAGGANACILHYIENDQPLVDGELLLIDAGAEWQYYASDVTRTFPVNGTFTPDQRALYEVVLEAQKAAIGAVRPGARFDDVHEAALHALVDGLIELGLCCGSREEVLESEGYRAFYMHRTSHWLGLDVHDCGAYSRDGASRALEPGMVLTVEPGLYIDPELDVDERWKGIGVRIEDDVLVTEAGYEVLTAGIPKEVADVEAACAGAALEAVR